MPFVKIQKSWQIEFPLVEIYTDLERMTLRRWNVVIFTTTCCRRQFIWYTASKLSRIASKAATHFSIFAIIEYEGMSLRSHDTHVTGEMLICFEYLHMRRNMAFHFLSTLVNIWKICDFSICYWYFCVNNRHKQIDKYAFCYENVHVWTQGE